jgi:hypothetical protein
VQRDRDREDGERRELRHDASSAAATCAARAVYLRAGARALRLRRAAFTRAPLRADAEGMRSPTTLLLGLLLAVAADAQTLHVATTGSDATGDGSPGAPFATIRRALNAAPDGATVLVQPGTYTGQQRLEGHFDPPVTVRSAERYRAQLRHTAAVVIAYDASGIRFEGFDVAHAGPGAGALVMQVQNVGTRSIGIRDNVFHDSWNNDILKINNGASNVLVEGNLFYVQSGSDEHMDVNSVEDVVIQDNVFFNDFAGSGRSADASTSSFIVVKDSNDADDGVVGAKRITVRRNLFLHWEGSPGSNFLLFGEDGKPYYETDGALVENNLMIGDGVQPMRAALGVKGSRGIVFRNNTVVGDLPSNAFAFRLNREGENLAVDDVAFYNNVWCDPTGSLGDFSDTPPADVAGFALDTNLYWNDGASIPIDATDLVNADDDAAAIYTDPLLPWDADALPLPRWDAQSGTFAGGFATIRDVFVAWATTYGTPATGSAAVDAARADQAAADDLLGRPRGAAPDLGAVEVPEPAAWLAALAAAIALQRLRRRAT